MKAKSILDLSNSTQVAKNAWAYVLLEVHKHAREADRCRTQWLNVIPMTNSSDNLRLQSDFKTKLPICDDVSQTKNYFSYAEVFRKTILATNYSDLLISYLPDKALALLPCSWDSVVFDQAQPQIYTIRRQAGAGNKMRIVLTTRQGAEKFTDSFGYPTVSFVSNIFGLVGLYLGYSLLDLYALGENMWFHLIEKLLFKIFTSAKTKT